MTNAQMRHENAQDIPPVSREKEKKVIGIGPFRKRPCSLEEMLIQKKKTCDSSCPIVCNVQAPLKVSRERS
jgi:hypothetical protein